MSNMPEVSPKGSTANIFLVHGQNHSVRDQLDLFLTKELGLRVTVMAAGPHQGRTLPEKFEEIAASCSFAVFLLTADDDLRMNDGRAIRRARQNVVLEVGYFWGAWEGVGGLPFWWKITQTWSYLRISKELVGFQSPEIWDRQNFGFAKSWSRLGSSCSWILCAWANNRLERMVRCAARY